MASEKAELAKALLAGRSFGVLTTNLAKMPGYPFGSLTPYAVDAEGRPLLLLSGLAVHTKNLKESPKASLFVFDEGAENDPQETARMNLVGTVEVVPEVEADAAMKAYLAKHPAAEQYSGFGDFDLYRLKVENLYLVGGFGVMGWVASSELNP